MRLNENLWKAEDHGGAGVIDASRMRARRSPPTSSPARKDLVAITPWTTASSCELRAPISARIFSLSFSNDAWPSTHLKQMPFSINSSGKADSMLLLSLAVC